MPDLTGFQGSFAWSPDGSHLAVATGGGTPPNGAGFVSRLQVIPADGGEPDTWTQYSTGVVDVAGWWPNGDGLLYWLDIAGSASIEADGLMLYSQPAGEQPRSLANTLVNTAWLSWNPGGDSVSLVAGGDRTIWEGNKHIETCNPATASCSTVPSPNGIVGLDPAWASSGTLAFISASDTGPFADTGDADPFAEGWMEEWDSTSQLVIAGPQSAIAVASAGPGVVAAQWSSNGTDLLLVKNDYLWIGSLTASPIQVAGPLYNTVAPSGYYGQVAWTSNFAWHSS